MKEVLKTNDLRIGDKIISLGVITGLADHYYRVLDTDIVKGVFTAGCAKYERGTNKCLGYKSIVIENANWHKFFIYDIEQCGDGLF
jgi:hypothetical protein